MGKEYIPDFPFEPLVKFLNPLFFFFKSKAVLAGFAYNRNAGVGNRLKQR